MSVADIFDTMDYGTAPESAAEALAWLVDQGKLTAAMAAKVKLVASETAVRCSEQAIRIFGGAGIMRDYPVGRIHRDALVYVIGEGTSEVQRNLIARSLDL